MNLHLRLPAFIFPVVLIVSILHADDLPRRGTIGLAVVASDTSHPQNPETNPLSIAAVWNGSAGEAAGIRPGDILRQIDGRKIVSSADFVAQIHSHVAGERVPVTITRGGRQLTLMATLKPRPFETSPDSSVFQAF